MKKMNFHVFQTAPSLSLLGIACCLWAAEVRAAGREGSTSHANEPPAGVTKSPPASPILSVVFDDPNSLFSAYPEGISLSDIRHDPEIQKQDVATGVGASTKAEIGGGDWLEDSVEPPKSLLLLSRPAEGIKSALRLNGNKLVPGTSGSVRITPQGVETSLASLSTFQDKKVFLNGGIDLFFRYSEEPQSNLLPGIFGSQGPGLHLTVEAHEGTVIAILDDEKNELVFDTDLDGAADAERVTTTFVNPGYFDPERFQHLAIWFHTREDGTVTLKVFFKVGAGSINTGEDVDLVSMGSFRIITEDSSKLFDHGSLVLAASSRNQPEVIHNDIAAFRLFTPAPAAFPELAEGK
jgi:hypothetical protein